MAARYYTTQGRTTDNRFYSMTYNRRFKTIRNRFRRVDRQTAALWILNKLNHVHLPDTATSEPLPWHLLLMLKWNVLCGGAERLQHKQQKLERELIRAYNETHDLAETLPLPSEYPDLQMFLRTLAHQQFWLFDRSPNRYAIARQLKLFWDRSDDAYYRDTFLRLTGVELRSFIELSAAVLAQFMKKHVMWTTSADFRPLAAHYGVGTIDKFLQLWSIGLDESQRLEEMCTCKVGQPEEYTEHSPFRFFPLLRVGGRFYRIYCPLLVHAVENYTYELFRHHDAAQFMQKFGGQFGEYGLDLIREANIEHLTENDLRRCVPASTKLVDALVHEDSANVFVEFKGVNLHERAMSATHGEVIYQKTKATLFKGIQQGLQTAAALHRQQSFVADENYLLVVTYAPLFLGNGDNYIEALPTQRRDALLRQISDTDFLIPARHIYFCSIGDFERLMALIASTHWSLGAFLRHCVAEDSEPATRKFDLGLHLNGVCTGEERLEALASKAKEVFDHLAAVLQEPTG